MKRVFLIILMLVITIVDACGQDAGKVVSIDTKNSSLILSVGDDGHLQALHYGGKISDPANIFFWKSYRKSDYGQDPQAYSAAGGRFFNEAAISATYSDGAMNTELIFVSDEKIVREDKTSYKFLLKDPKTSLEVRLCYDAYVQEDVIVCHSEIRNASATAVVLRNYYSGQLHVRADKYLLSHYYGSWAREMNVDREILTHGIKSIESKMEVRTTHNENPSFMLSLNTESFNENFGEVIAGALAWSGNFKMVFQMDETSELDVLCGVNPYAAEYELKAGETLVTPDFIYTYSSKGAGGASRNLHDWARRHWMYSDTLVPTLLNSWEGAYFDFNTKVITDMIDDAASLGLEMFVLDDGWFGNKYPRNSSRQGLGDWQLNKKKIPQGIGYLAEYAHSKGLKFGIWIEPEMVNPKSVLYEKHPEWIVAEAGRQITETRNQLLLDLSNPQVQDFVFGVFNNTMKQASGIDYIKWDANRHVENFGALTLGRQSHFWMDYVCGFYSVLERIRAKYPDVMIQCCSSGGGRVEYGSLKYFDEFWTSDNTEARQRARIQYGTNMIYPASVTGSHVSAVPNHQSNNVTPLKFRFDMAASGRLGMELQPKSLSDEERSFAARAIESYKSYRDLIQNGDLYRLLSPYDTDYYSLMYVSKDGKRAVVFVYCLEYQGRVQLPQVRMYGLDSALRYRLTELNVDKSDFWGDGMIFGGDFLVNEGINPNLRKIYDSAIYYLVAE